MQNKKEFRLRTVFATGWVQPKSTAALHSLFTSEPKHNLLNKSQHSSKKRTKIGHQKQSNRKIHNFVLCKTQRNQSQNHTDIKSNLKQFPRRECILKNSNAFKYFLPSNSRANTQPRNQQGQFFKKLSQLIKQGPFAKSICRLSLKMQDQRFYEIKDSSKPNKPKQFKRRYTTTDNQFIEPWKLRDTQYINDLHIQ